MQTHAWRRAKVATTAAATTAIASYLYLLNEDVVSKRAARLERLQKCADVQPRVAPDDKAAQLSMEAPIVVRGLLDSWPAMGDSARSWTWGNLRRRMGHSLVDAGTQRILHACIPNVRCRLRLVGPLRSGGAVCPCERSSKAVRVRSLVFVSP